ncbi:MAG: CoA ester lyase [Paeniglutamicibacter terrestris]
MTYYSPAQRQVGDATTALFVPATRPERFAKAASTSADVVLIDLEDAVAPEHKTKARASSIEALSRRDGFKAVVRINAVGTPYFADDLEALTNLANTGGHGLLGLMVPKAETTDTIGEIAELTRSLGLSLVPLIESATGLINAFDLARTPGVTRLAFGAIDFCLDIDSSLDERVLDHARSVLVLTSRAAGIRPPLDSPTTEIRDLRQVAESTRLARNFGFGGKLCIHPAQVAVVNSAFTPSEEDLRWATKVVQGDDAILEVDGQMIDRPVIERAKRILRRAS